MDLTVIRNYKSLKVTTKILLAITSLLSFIFPIVVLIWATDTFKQPTNGATFLGMTFIWFSVVVLIPAFGLSLVTDKNYWNTNIEMQEAFEEIKKKREKTDETFKVVQSHHIKIVKKLLRKKRVCKTIPPTFRH